ncbi:cytidylyltransferase domain-containing protein [Flavobacterium sp. LC2016-12]|uniref:acylneuraminate cytidylyltransferase family protein n=1 Tax=Flavobacterium sp. LC2016-12 TaxID=2783794 RepID=UPI00188BC2BC|nr:acylneuraminate cytidylyltransferase family protein [Flavobacterium sp. LC2016-12]MBF4465683.1 acylneuraminate cytidylyltransferase family protein [Flavobacterium sp. LC2016-12]
MLKKKVLYIIPARGGSKGVLNKNIRNLNGKPLIYYSIEAVLEISDSEDICVSTDSLEIKKIVEDYGLKVPFLRPSEIASDSATTEDVLLHAINFYKSIGVDYEYIVYLQPTSPLRRGEHIKGALKLIEPNTELIVSVKETDSNPYYVLFEENTDGILKKTKEGIYTRRQDCPVVYELNGAIYIINVDKLLEKGYQKLNMMKYVMPKEVSIDIDDIVDFKIAEVLIKEMEL